MQKPHYFICEGGEVAMLRCMHRNVWHGQIVDGAATRREFFYDMSTGMCLGGPMSLNDFAKYRLVGALNRDK